MDATGATETAEDSVVAAKAAAMEKQAAVTEGAAGDPTIAG